MSSDLPPLPRLRVLFVCAMNRRRSVTAEHVFRHDARLEVRSAGVRTDANRRVSAADLAWADVVFCMERDQKAWLAERFRDQPLPRIEVLDIPDDYACDDPELQALLRRTLEPEWPVLRASR